MPSRHANSNPIRRIAVLGVLLLGLLALGAAIALHRPSDADLIRARIHELRDAAESRNLDVIERVLPDKFFEDAATRATFITNLAVVANISSRLQVSLERIDIEIQPDATTANVVVFYSGALTFNNGPGARYQGTYGARTVPFGQTRELARRAEATLRRIDGRWEFVNVALIDVRLPG